MMQETNAWETMLNGEQGVVLNSLLGALERLPCQRSAVESTEALVGHQALRSGSRTRRRRRKRSWAGRLAPIRTELS